MSFLFPVRLELIACTAMSVAMLLLSGCNQAPPVAQSTALPASPFKVHASVQELMEAIVDPSADAVWDSVGTVVTKAGSIDHQPQTPEEWKQVRLHAIALIEGTNLLMMDGRRLVPEGGKILDEGEEGVLSTAEAEQMLKSEHGTFVQFASALNDVAVQMLKAIDAKQPEAMVQAGEAMDEVCESCHLKFWYPRQAIWRVSQGTTQTDATQAPKK
jgi:hypothetical protein